MDLEEAYKILGISHEEDDLNVIKKKYKEKMKKLHPDVGGNVEDFKKVKSAFDIIVKRLSTRKNILRVKHITLTKFKVGN